MINCTQNSLAFFFIFLITDSASCIESLPVSSTELFEGYSVFRTFHLLITCRPKLELNVSSNPVLFYCPCFCVYLITVAFLYKVYIKRSEELKTSDRSLGTANEESLCSLPLCVSA